MSMGSRGLRGEPLAVVGGGLAGCEAAWQAACRGLDVILYEMRPEQSSPAHQGHDLGELVCSNSLRSGSLANAAGLLKAEMRRLGSVVMQAADATAVPAGKALAVDRAAFAKRLTEAISTHPRISVRRQRVDRIPDGLAVVTTGPLTAAELAAEIQGVLGAESLYFYDAISPIVHGDSIDRAVAFPASRYEPGEGDYLNLPLEEPAYRRFVDALRAADTVPLHPFERALYFEGCLPIEEMARRGAETLAHGPMRPVGLVDPRTGRRPYAVVQLRREDREGILYNLVGFQTKLRIGEQRRILRELPGLAEAVFARYGSVHRNTYVNAPRSLTPTLELRARPGVLLAGQMAGVEGYVESAALGGLAGIHAVFLARRRSVWLPPPTTAHGALLRHLREADPAHFQPMNVNYGLFPPLADSRRRRKRERNLALAARALEAFDGYVERLAGGVA